jgi:N-ATPase, AtpR subunit
MDASAMSITLWLLAGLAGGMAHFALLRWNTALYLTGSVAAALGLRGVRMALTTALLVVAVRHGALPLLLAALGVLLARPMVMRAIASTV